MTIPAISIDTAKTAHPSEVVILGSTGSIGTQALELLVDHSEQFVPVALAAGGGNPDLLASQIKEHRPRLVSVASDADNSRFREVIEAANLVGAELLFGATSPADVAAAFPGSTVLNGINGAVGLGPTLAALEAGCTLALANKESLVAGGPVVKRAIQRAGQIVPVDSEHSAIAQALLSGRHQKGMVSPVLTGESELRSIVLTASGGPFRGRTRSELTEVTAAQALAHPTWTMGPVVTINSSTLMNKALELIEASLLFDVPPSQIIPVIHPQSMIHSMVTWNDGSTIAQASYPDMKVPIALGLSWPEHMDSVGTPIDWSVPGEWTFEPVDMDTFPALDLARSAMESSGTHPAVLNAANEVCVDAFLRGELAWLGIIDVVDQVLQRHDGIADPALEEILEAQRWAAALAQQLISLGEGNS